MNKFLISCVLLFTATTAFVAQVQERRVVERTEAPASQRLAPLPPLPVALPTASGRGERNVRWVRSTSEDRAETRITMRNDVRFNDDYTDVLSISKNGFFQIREDRGSVVRQFEAVPDANGEVQRRYLVQGEAREFDLEAQKWLKRMLADAVRDGLDAEARAKRIFKEHGAAGVLDEATRLRGDHAKAVFFKTLIGDANSDPETLRQIFAQAARQLSSNHEKAELLIKAMELDLTNAELRAVFAEGVNNINSDYERGRIVSTLLRQHKNNPDVLLLAVKLTVGLASDYEKAVGLIRVAQMNSPDAAVRSALLEAAQAISSDYERGRVLAVLQEKNDR